MSTATCAWRPQSPIIRAICDLAVDSGHPTLCILHDPDTHKGVGRFNQALREKIALEEADDNVREINLVGVKFPGIADFRGQVFKKAVTFAEARFTRGADFGRTRFNGEAYFRDTNFPEQANFGDAQFERGAYFWMARFGATAYFRVSRFDAVADFGAAQFEGGANFAGTQFEGVVRFGQAQFGGLATFDGAHFAEAADFWEARFSGGAGFEKAHFSRRVYFGGAQFRRVSSFSQAVVESSLNFVGPTLAPDVTEEAEIRFRELTPESARRLSFQNVDLSRASFLNTDVSQVHFVGCSWARKDSPLLWPLPLPWPRQLRPVIYDETTLGWPMAREYRRLVAELYRQLRLNYEASHQEVEAEHFYIGQMEMRRQDPSYPRPYRWMLAAYRVLAMYGESYLRPPFFYCFGGMVLAFGYLLAGFEAVGKDTIHYHWSLGLPGILDYLQALVQALTAGGVFGLGSLGGEFQSQWAPVVRYINALWDILLVGMFLVAMRRHFQR